MQILGFLGMYFDAVVVKVKTFLLLFRLTLAILFLVGLKEHIRLVHEKIPCIECGKLVGPGRLMKDHIASVHTPNDQKKYKCEVCGKGFSTARNLNDHINIHTGEKPYKCKFCSACFASKGNHGSHIRSHLGTNRRDSSKKLIIP